MALTTDTTINFPTGGSGYTFDAATVEFVSNIARLKSGAGLTTKVLMTPEIDRDGWASPRPEIRDTVATAADLVGYYNNYAVSFDQAGSWKTWEGGRFRSLNMVDNADPTADSDDADEIRDNGISRHRLAQIRNWGSEQFIRFAVAMTRETAGVLGNVGLLTLQHGHEITSWSGTPAAPDTIAYEPDQVQMRLVQPTTTMRFEDGHTFRMAEATLMRHVYEVTYRMLTAADKDTLVAFLQAREELPFEWQPPGEAAKLKFTSSEPEVIRVATEAWIIRATLTQNYTPEYTTL